MPATKISPIRIVHTSDVHLDGRYSSKSDTTVEDGFRNDAERAFASVVDVSIEVNADLLLVVGDLFDNARVPDTDFTFVCQQLARTPSQVVILPGNHDQHDEYSVWHRIELSAAGTHVHAMLDHQGNQLDFNDLSTTLWGRAMEEHAPDNVPLQGTPARRDNHWNIGLAHGQVVSERGGHSSSQITHAEIGASGFDYLALGHIHVWNDVSQGPTTACYPGSPVAAFASDKGGHVAVITLRPDRGVELEKRRIQRAPESTA